MLLFSDSAPCGSQPSYDLSRTKSFRIEPKNQRIFRASDLVQGKLLGKGFFGQVYLVSFEAILWDVQPCLAFLLLSKVNTVCIELVYFELVSMSDSSKKSVNSQAEER